MPILAADDAHVVRKFVEHRAVMPHVSLRIGTDHGDGGKGTRAFAHGPAHGATLGANCRAIAGVFDIAALECPSIAGKQAGAHFEMRIRRVGAVHGLTGHVKKLLIRHRFFLRSRKRCHFHGALLHGAHGRTVGGIFVIIAHQVKGGMRRQVADFASERMPIFAGLFTRAGKGNHAVTEVAPAQSGISTASGRALDSSRRCGRDKRMRWGRRARRFRGRCRAYRD